jgi:hypothetical protein
MPFQPDIGQIAEDYIRQCGSHIVCLQKNTYKWEVQYLLQIYWCTRHKNVRLADHIM